MNPDEILKAANGVIISSSCGCQHKAANGAKIQDSDFYDKEFAKELELKYGKNTRFKAVATNEELEKLYGRKLADSEIKGIEELKERIQDKKQLAQFTSWFEELKQKGAKIIDQRKTFFGAGTMNFGEALFSVSGDFPFMEIYPSNYEAELLIAKYKNSNPKAADGKSIEKWDTGAGVDVYSFMRGDEVYLNGVRDPFGMVTSIGEKNVMVKRHSDGKIVPMPPTKLWVGKNIPYKAADGLSVDKSDWIKSVTHDVTSNGIPFTEEIVSHKGASFTLFPISDLQKTSKFIDKAKSEIRNQRDAVSIKVADDNDWDELYKSAYFRDPRTKVLKWYQIEQDEKLIRSERKKGTTPTEFVDKFVLPFTKETEKKFRDRSGDKIELLKDGGETRGIYVHSVKNHLDNKKEPVIVGGHTLVYQRSSKIMGGNGVSGTIRTIPQGYYVATIDKEGKISFEDLESKTKDIDKEEVTKQWYWKNIVEHFASPYYKEKSDWKAENGSPVKSEAEMRAVYVEAFGQEFDSPLRKQSPLPIEMAYKVALNKLLKDKRVELWEMPEDPHPVPVGTMGTILGIDGIGQIMVKWDNGSSLSLIPGVDKYKIYSREDINGSSSLSTEYKIHDSKDYFAAGGPINKDKVAEIMHEFKDGTLKDSHGNLVTNRKQAIAIALSVASRMAADGKEVGSDWSRIEQNEKEFEAAMKHLGIPKKDWEKYRNDFAANGKRVKEIVVTKMSDIENIEDKINEGKVTYRGLGMGKLADDFYKVAGEPGKRIKVDGKEYFVTDADYRQYEWDAQKGGWKHRIKFNAPYRKYDNGGGIVVNENDDMELWFSPGGQHMMPKPKGTALHMFEGILTQKIGAKQLELTESNDHEYVYQIIGNMDRINQKISELKGFEVETYGMQKRVHIPIEIINQVVLSIRYPLMTPYAEGGPVKDWADNLGVTNEDMKWIDQIEKEHIEEDIIWLFYENYRSAEEAENAKSKADIKIIIKASKIKIS